MSTIPPRNLTKPHLDALAGLAEAPGSPAASELERRAQELINEWLRFYFSGNAFTTPAVTGPDLSITHDNCEILFDHAVPTIPSAKPILHTLLADRRDDDGHFIEGNLKAHLGDWTYNTLIRVAPQLPANATGTADTNALRNAGHTCRRVADQLAWLLRSAHTQDLAFKGICKVRVLNGPRLIQSGSWIMRQIVWSAQVHYLIPHGAPR